MVATNIDNAKFASGKLENLLSGYSCPANPDIEIFLKDNAIDFSKRFVSKTYIVHEGKGAELFGYFALTPKSIVFDKKNALSRKFADRLKRFLNQDKGVTMLTVILIAQIGKNFADGIGEKIRGAEVLALAEGVVSSIHQQVGGRLVEVECEDIPSVRNFYEANGFVHLQDRKTKDGNVLIQYLKYIKGEESQD